MFVTSKIKSMVVCCLVLIMMVAMTACGSKEKEEEYLTNFQASLNQLTALNTTMTKNIEAYLTSFAETDKTTLITTIDDVSKAYEALKAIEAPKGFEEIQGLFAEGADKAVPALEIYKNEFSKVTVESFNADFVARIAEGDKVMEEANQKLIDAGTKVEEKLGGATEKDKKKDKDKENDKDKADGESSDEKKAESKKVESKDDDTSK